MTPPRVAVVVPCHNEAATLIAVVRGAAPHGDVIVVDDRSDDGSGFMARAAGARVIDAARPGYDGAVDTGLRHAYGEGYSHIVTIDADGEHDPALVAAFKVQFELGVPLICGYRPAPQRAAEYVVGAYGRLALGVRDLLCGMKGYSRQVVHDYIASGAPLLVNMAPAVLWRKAGGAYGQLPVTGTRRTDQPRFGRRLAANRAILKSLIEVARL
jgi:glycosyltransferase involved in cell wall biosynthesis